MRFFTLLLLIFVTSRNLYAQNNIDQILRMQYNPALYTVQKTNKQILIDGKDDDQAWKAINLSSNFNDIEGNHKEPPAYNTQIKMLWDDKNLYIYAKLEEPHVWGTLDQHDDIIYHNNDFEVFIKPYENQAAYFEIEVNTLNTILDLLMTKPYRFGGEAILQWDVKGLKSAIHIEGTNNNPNDIDQYWSVEMAIPFESLKSFGRKNKPEIGEYWRINFSRVQWEHEITDGKYSRKLKDGKLIPEKNWVMNPIGIIDMHNPQQWAFLQFTDIPAGKVGYPSSFRVEQFCWKIFYLQNLYRQKHNKYASDLNSLNEIHNFSDRELREYKCELITNENKSFYRIEIKDLYYNITSSLDSQGNYTINYDK